MTKFQAAVPLIFVAELLLKKGESIGARKAY